VISQKQSKLCPIINRAHWTGEITQSRNLSQSEDQMVYRVESLQLALFAKKASYFQNAIVHSTSTLMSQGITLVSQATQINDNLGLAIFICPSPNSFGHCSTLFQVVPLVQLEMSSG
jgi:hypothetical protein